VQKHPGMVHFERRLHRLMMLDEIRAYDLLHCGSGPPSLGLGQTDSSLRTSREERESSGFGTAGPVAVTLCVARDCRRAAQLGRCSGGGGCCAASGGAVLSDTGGFWGGPCSTSANSESSPASKGIMVPLFSDGELRGSVADALPRLPAPYSTTPVPGPGMSPPHVIEVQYAPYRKYWFVRVTCCDRNKLLFDLVCTIVDLDFDVFHASLDTEDRVSVLEFYIRPRLGGSDFDEHKGRRLAVMLKHAIFRRVPKGVPLRMVTPQIRQTVRCSCMHAVCACATWHNPTVRRGGRAMHAR
jgi:hypothetical protein